MVNVKWQNTLSEDATTEDTLKAIVALINEYSKDSFAINAAEVIKQEADSTHTNFLELLFKWACENVDYKLDSLGTEVVATPALSTLKGVADCKKFSILLGSILEAADYNPILKHVEYSADTDWTHIYVIVPLTGFDPMQRNTYLVLDPTNNCEYNAEVEYKSATIYYLNGDTMKLVAMGNSQPGNKQTGAPFLNFGHDIGFAAGSVLDSMRIGAAPVQNDSLSIARGIVLTMINNNVNGIADKIATVLSTNPNLLDDVWTTVGGHPDDLKELVLRGIHVTPINIKPKRIGNTITTDWDAPAHPRGHKPPRGVSGPLSTRWSGVGRSVNCDTPLCVEYMKFWKEGQNNEGYYGWAVGPVTEETDISFRNAYAQLINTGYKVPMPYGKGQMPAIPNKQIGDGSIPNATYTQTGNKFTFNAPWGSYTDTLPNVMYWVAMGPGTSQELNTWIQQLDTAGYGGDIQNLENQYPQRDSNPDQMCAFINGIISRIGSPATQNNQWLIKVVNTVGNAVGMGIGVPGLGNDITGAYAAATSGSGPGGPGGIPQLPPNNGSPGNSGGGAKTGPVKMGSLAASAIGWFFKCVFLGIALPHNIHFLNSAQIGTTLLIIGVVGSLYIHFKLNKPCLQKKQLAH